MVPIQDQRALRATKRSIVRIGALLGHLAFAVLISMAQEADTIILANHQQNFTIVANLDDPRERQAFMDVYNAHEPAPRHALAMKFIEMYPQSWMLAQTYDLAARSSIDLGDYQAALAEARFSLRLLPENPMLLVLVANVEAQNKLLADVRESARTALDFLDEFERPGSMTEQQWKQIRPQLKASAYFALGRAYALEGLADTTPSRRSELNQASRALNSAVAWNPDDPEFFYLRALVELASGEQLRGSSDMAFVTHVPNPLSAKARQELQQIYSRSSHEPALSFDQFLKSLPPPQVDRGLRESGAGAKSSPAIQQGYAGSASCRSCHEQEYDTWQQTGMARMLREYRAENLIGDFLPGTQFKGESGKSLIRMGIDKRPYFEFNQGGAWQRFYVDYTIGSKWQQGYATRLPDGSFHVFPIEYNALRKTWINYWEIIDPPGSERAVISDFPKMLPVTNYQENCAICHTSQLRAGMNVEDPLQHAVFKEPGVNCEMCHGPSAWHVKRMRSGQTVSKKRMEPPVDFRQIDNREGVRICAQCHRQTAVREIGADREMNYSTETASYVPRTWSRAYDSFSRRALYKDGRFRESTFIVEAFTRSACYRKGTAQCASCHAPHLQTSAANQNCVKFENSPSEICLQCHSEYRDRVSEHTHHAPNAEASQCASCHMPRIVNALLFKARSHEIEIPRADLTERFGQKESPNACLLCHTEKTAEWADRQLGHWKN